MNAIQRLIEIFGHFPGIGPRQAKRFVYYLLARNDSAIHDLITNLDSLKKEVSVCAECMRFYEKKNKENNLCEICSDPNRDLGLLMIVSRDTDMDAIEKSGAFGGKYFILGGSVPILEKEPDKKIRTKELLALIGRRIEIQEIILAMNANPEGENTEEYVRSVLGSVLSPAVKISVLGKGISTGLELEYTDRDTMKYALQNRG